jgi:RNA polymerase sigma factor (sigma-70 family)
MSSGQLKSVLQYLRQVLDRQAAGDGPDGELLERFASQRDEAAFTALMRRHGPMVLGVCRRVLHDSHDADDAFQATFLVLVRKAGSLRRPELLANWLYGVAYRTAMDARSAALRRQKHERQAMKIPVLEESSEPVWRELRPVLDAELSCLPEKYRVPLVLCYLEGKTKEQAAKELGWPEGTVSGRLARARDLLRTRLERRGVTLPAGVLATVLAQNAAEAMVPAALMLSTTKAALIIAASKAAAASVLSTQVAALMEGVLKAMFWKQLRIGITALMAASIVGTGAGLIAYRSLAADGSQDPAKPEAGQVATEVPKKPQLSDEERKYIAEIVDPQDTLDLLQGHTRLLLLKESPKFVKMSSPVFGGAHASFPGMPGMPGGGPGMAPGGTGDAYMPGAPGMPGGRGGEQDVMMPGDMGPGSMGPAGMVPGGMLPGAMPGGQIVTHELITKTHLSLTGRVPGTAVLYLWFSDPAGRNDPQRILGLLIRVRPTPAPGADAKTPKATDQSPRSGVFREHVREVIDPQKTMDLMLGRPRILLLHAEPTRVMNSDDRVASCNWIFGDSEKELFLEGIQVGTTVLTLSFPDREDKTKGRILCYLIRVVPPPPAQQPSQK